MHSNTRNIIYTDQALNIAFITKDKIFAIANFQKVQIYIIEWHNLME